MPTTAFLSGLFELVPTRWVTMFNEAELQMLISGSEAGLDLEDLKQNVNFAGGAGGIGCVCVTSVQYGRNLAV